MSLSESISGLFKEILQTALISLGIFFFVYVFLIQPHRVKGDSMKPNYLDGELLLTEKVSYRLYQPERGDVIVFKSPSRDVDFIKRIIGIPGDQILIDDGFITVNGEKLKEPYISQPTQGNVELTISKDSFFVLGDNRGASSDSRSFGEIKKSSIKGKAWVVYWPIFRGNNFEGARSISGIDYSVPDPF